jgi:hypothetical protein
MKRIIFPLAVIVGIAAAAFSGAHGAAHPVALAFIDHVRSNLAFID